MKDNKIRPGDVIGPSDLRWALFVVEVMETTFKYFVMWNSTDYQWSGSTVKTGELSSWCDYVRLRGDVCER